MISSIHNNYELRIIDLSPMQVAMIESYLRANKMFVDYNLVT